ncbi:MAG: glycosyltransferase family 4 protein [Bacteroidales bacterium]|nr:glycosyltransferase family 4 protein [Candidatus Minthousia equi]
MRILFITNNLPPLVDGVGDYTYNLAHEFAKHGHEVHVVCINREEIRDDYKDIHVAKIVKKWNKLAGKDIAVYIRENGIEVVSLQYVPYAYHSKGLPFGLITALKEIKKTGVRLMTFCHEVCIGLWDKHTVKNVIYAATMQYITKQVLNCSDSVATSIDHYARKIRQFSPKHKDVVCIPIASNVPVTTKSTEELFVLRRSVADNDQQKIIGFFGCRDCETSIKAIEELQKEGHDLKMLFIGKVSEKTLSLIPNDAYTTGILDIEDIDQYLRIADAIVIPCKNGVSFKNGAFIAALNANKPVITASGFMTDEDIYNVKDLSFVDFDNIKRIKESLLPVLKSSYKQTERYIEIKEVCSFNNAYAKYLNTLL